MKQNDPMVAVEYDSGEDMDATVLVVSKEHMQAEILKALVYSHEQTKSDIAQNASCALNLINLRLQKVNRKEAEMYKVIILDDTQEASSADSS